jgi:hypothetical protein
MWGGFAAKKTGAIDIPAHKPRHIGCRPFFRKAWAFFLSFPRRRESRAVFEGLPPWREWLLCMLLPGPHSSASAVQKTKRFASWMGAASNAVFRISDFIGNTPAIEIRGHGRWGYPHLPGLYTVLWVVTIKASKIGNRF